MDDVTSREYSIGFARTGYGFSRGKHGSAQRDGCSELILCSTHPMFPLLFTLRGEQRGRGVQTELEDIGDSTNEDGYDNQRDTCFDHHQEFCSMGQREGVCRAERCRSRKGDKEVVDEIGGPLLSIALLLLGELQIDGLVDGLMPLAWSSAIGLPVPERKDQDIKHPQ